MMKKKRGLEKKVRCNAIKLPRHRDSVGSYLPYCTFAGHMGPVKDTRKCSRNECRYYTKLYLLLGDKPYVD